MDVLYVDNHLLALNKPAGLLTQPSGTSEDNLEDRAKLYQSRVPQARRGVPGGRTPH